MRMEAMVERFKEKGFDAVKKYDAATKSYRFTISRDGKELTRYFTYPVDVPPVVRDSIQKLFIKTTISSFDKELEELNKKCNIYITTARSDNLDKLVKDWQETLLNMCKGEKMKNYKINWKAHDCVYESSSDPITPNRFHAIIDGDLIGPYCGHLSDLKNEIETRLNADSISELDIYITRDLAAKNTLNGLYGTGSWTMPNCFISNKPKIKNVVFNDPATIVFWMDGDKTIVKCQNDDVFDAEKGLAMAIVKKVLGNKGNYCNELKKWLPEEKEEKKVSQKDCKLQAAYHVLYPVLHDPKATKKDMVEAIEEAIGYIGEMLDE